MKKQLFYLAGFCRDGLTVEAICRARDIAWIKKRWKKNGTSLTTIAKYRRV